MQYATMHRGGPADGAELQQAVKARCDLIAAEWRAAKTAGNAALCDSLKGELEMLKRLPEQAMYRRVRRGLSWHLSHPTAKRSAADDLAEINGVLALDTDTDSKTPRRGATMAGDLRSINAALAGMTGRTSRPAARREAFCDWQELDEAEAGCLI